MWTISPALVPSSRKVKAAIPSPDLNATAASLLGFLKARPQSGYELAAAIENSIGNFWNVTRSQIYRELGLLESYGFVRVGEVGVRERKPYALTALGSRAFDAWIAANRVRTSRARRSSLPSSSAIASIAPRLHGTCENIARGTNANSRSIALACRKSNERTAFRH